ncbi:DUF3899 domain-containing protein [Virgibacillus sp. DJP39]|uniref:DUF3899 domain-containing protein n=1 Tax=Virgibacillus sp. DJP39 TaxID=3409790 RepID=UPI003BB50448
MLRKVASPVLLTLSIATISSLFIDHSINLLNLINSLFMYSLLLTVVSSAMLVLQGGFFNGIVRSSKRLIKNSNPTVRVLNEVEGKKSDLNPYKITFSLTIPCLVAGLLLLVISILFSWVITI